MYYIDKDQVLDKSDFKAYVEAFKIAFLPGLQKLDQYYHNDNEIVRREFEDTSKPNNKMAHSFAHYITTTNTTMFISSPVTYKSEDNLEDYEKVLEIADEQDVNINLANNASKYGYAIQLLYVNEEPEIKMTVLDNLHTVLIFSDDVNRKLLYAISFWSTENFNDKTTHEYITVYSKEETIRYKDDIEVERANNKFNNIPVILYKNNEDMTGDYEHVIPLIDAYDLLESDSLNENEYFNNAYLYLNAVNLDPGDVAKMKENRVIYGEGLNPAFITKNAQNTDGDVEKKRIVTDIHKLSYTPDLSDENFANNVSGVAMKYKLLGTLNNIANKQRKFKRALTDRNKLIFDMMATRMMEVPKYVDIVFTVNLPNNLLETAQMINQLRGVVSNETLISQLPFVENPAWELEQVASTSSIDTFEDDVNE